MCHSEMVAGCRMDFLELVKTFFEQELDALLHDKASSSYRSNSKKAKDLIIHIEVIMERLFSCLLFQFHNLELVAPTFSKKVALLRSLHPSCSLLNSASLGYLHQLALSVENNATTRASLPSATELRSFVEEFAVQVSLRVALERALPRLHETVYDGSLASDQNILCVGLDFDSALDDLKIILRRGGAGF